MITYSQRDKKFIRYILPEYAYKIIRQGSYRDNIKTSSANREVKMNYKGQELSFYINVQIGMDFSKRNIRSVDLHNKVVVVGADTSKLRVRYFIDRYGYCINDGVDSLKDVIGDLLYDKVRQELFRLYRQDTSYIENEKRIMSSTYFARALLNAGELGKDTIKIVKKGTRRTTKEKVKKYLKETELAKEIRKIMGDIAGQTVTMRLKPNPLFAGLTDTIVPILIVDFEKEKVFYWDTDVPVRLLRNPLEMSFNDFFRYGLESVPDIYYIRWGFDFCEVTFSSKYMKNAKVFL